MRRLPMTVLGMLSSPILVSAATQPVQVPPPVSAPSPAGDIFAGRSEDPRTIGLRAFVWGYPLVRAAQLRQNLTLPDDPLRPRPPSSPGAAINRFGHARELGSPKMRQGVAPNNDTLYSLAWLDTDDGPFVLETPDFGDRYYTFQMGQADSSTVQALGARTHGAKLPPVFITGPRSRAATPPGMIRAESSQRYLMIAGRVLVRSAADVSAVAVLQQRIRLRRWDDVRQGRGVLPPISPQRRVDTASFTGKPDAFLTALGEVLRDYVPLAGEEALLRSFRRIGLSTDKGYAPQTISDTVRAAAARGLAEGEAAVRQKTFTLGVRENGWSVNRSGSLFGRDHLLRAAVAMDQIYVLPRDEALYPNARLDADGQVLDGRRRYELRFTKAQLPPVRFFWSATMYHAEGLMVENGIGRYAIGDRTPGLVREPDGGLRILIQSAPPPASEQANWLPAPAGPFMLMLRLYGPLAPALNGHWKPPAIHRLDTETSH